MLGARSLITMILSIAMLSCPLLSADITLDLSMPTTQFGPCTTCSLDLLIDNPGSAVSDAQLFVVFSVGTDDFWFYPGWTKYPPDLDWEVVDIDEESEEIKVIIPEFTWPGNAGTFSSASFYAAVLHEDVLISNLAEFTFGWTNEFLPVPTPGYPTPTPLPAPEGWVYIQPGSFIMGSPEDEDCRWGEMENQRHVTLTRGFFMMETEVTRRMWADLETVEPDLPADPSYVYYSPTMNHPVQYCTWSEAVLYANLLSIQDGYNICFYRDPEFTEPIDVDNYLISRYEIFCDFDADGYRLPTEAEWEYACRAGTTGPFSFYEPKFVEPFCNSNRCDPGDFPVFEQYGVFCANAGGKNAPVGSKLPNPWGLYDMHGNVWDLCWSWYGEFHLKCLKDPRGPVSGNARISRGGSSGYTAVFCRSAFKSYLVVDDRRDDTGFRLVRTAN